MRFRKILRSPTSTNHSLNARSPLVNDERSFAVRGTSEAEQFYEALKLLNVDTVLVRVPEEPHGISRRPSYHVAKMLCIAGWFEQHKSKP
jgi:dipeptidyl aminopeptidase/acylaminoacyl peptidase